MAANGPGGSSTAAGSCGGSGMPASGMSGSGSATGGLGSELVAVPAVFFCGAVFLDMELVLCGYGFDRHLAIHAGEVHPLDTGLAGSAELDRPAWRNRSEERRVGKECR